LYRRHLLYDESKFYDIDPRVCVDHEYSFPANLSSSQAESDGNAGGVKKLVLKPITREEVMASLARMPSSLPVVVKPVPVKLNIKETVFKGYSKAHPVIIRRDILSDEKDPTQLSGPGLHLAKPVGNYRAAPLLPHNIPRDMAAKYARCRKL
jgi:hypothetical protein